jgi:hypothetical protein
MAYYRGRSWRSDCHYQVAEIIDDHRNPAAPLQRNLKARGAAGMLLASDIGPQVGLRFVRKTTGISMRVARQVQQIDITHLNFGSDT